MKSALLLLATFMIVAASGCGGNSAGVGVHSTSWDIHESGAVAVKGIDDAQVVIGSLGSSPSITLWSDCHGSSGAGSSNATGVQFTAKLQTEDGRALNVEAMNLSGQEGIVVIDNQPFDLTKGRFFLISTANSKTQVKQLERTLPASLLNTLSENRHDSFRKFAKADPEIMAFYASGASEKPSTPEWPAAIPAAQ